MATADKLVNYISKISRKTYKKKIEKTVTKIIGVLDQFLIYQHNQMKEPPYCVIY